jgi:uncharacterized damage-inducible protein DinB
MRKQIGHIISSLHTVVEGEPWFGKSVMTLLNEVDANIVYKKPNEASHSLIELLYHMITWAEFTLKRIEGEEDDDITAFDKMDWRQIDSNGHTWEKAVAQFKVTNDLIIDALQSKNDEFLNGKVDYREYNFRFLLNGLIQHNIYHAGQIAYLRKLLSAEVELPNRITGSTSE